MVLKRNRKGQAAIEFLMTYGWMLLVVLIVGALIFSFVDFGSLLPNQLDLSNSLRADASQMVASSSTNVVSIVFTYLGTRASTITPEGIAIESDIGYGCNATQTSPWASGVNITNIDTGNAASALGSQVQFINGQIGILRVACEADQMITGDVLEGQVTIPVKNTRTGLEVTSRGRIRLTIEE